MRKMPFLLISAVSLRYSYDADDGEKHECSVSINQDSDSLTRR